MPETKLITPEIPDQGRVFDEDEAEWVSGWQNFFRRQKVVVFVDKIVFNATTTGYISSSFKCAPYRFAELLLEVVKSGAPTNITVTCYSSDDNITFYEFVSNTMIPQTFTASAKTSMYDRVHTSYFRVEVVVTGTTAVNTFTCTAKVSFAS